MSEHQLVLSTGIPAGLTTNDLLWRPAPLASSFRTSISPGLEELDGSTAANIDFVRLAILTYLVDRTQRRPRSGWSRVLSLTVPVDDPGRWSDVAGELARLLAFLTSDKWSLQFVPARPPPASRRIEAPAADLVSLLSGGADSLCGALAAEPAELCVVSHHDWTLVRHYQTALVAALTALWDRAPATVSILVGRSHQQLGSHADFGEEKTSRSRSLLFLALGLAVASRTGAPLWVPENGFASLNPPLGGERIGSLSTKTTHPWYLWRLGLLLRQVGAHAEFTNPFATQTKGEMFRDAAAKLGADDASTLLSRSHSCSRGDLRFAGIAGVSHCGVCFGCLVRRAAFAAAELDDKTPYAVEDLRSAAPGALSGWLSPGRLRDLEAVRYAAARGLDAAVIIGSPLPPDVAPSDAINLAHRGLDELDRLTA